MSTDAIVADNIKYNYGDIQAVKGITFSVKEGEIFWLFRAKRGWKIHHNKNAHRPDLP